jgi:electron-transferring-flavoprotein dehydrogenase
MLAAETAYHALLSQKFDAPQLKEYPDAVENSWIKKELWPVRNFHQGFEKGFLHGMFHAALQQVTGGRGLHRKYASQAGYKQMEHIDQLPQNGGSRAAIIGPARREGTLSFDKVTDVYYSGTKHEEDQPSHLIIHDTNICNQRCIQEYGNPCQNFCPANVYEMVESSELAGAKQIHLNPSNCVHCKTCDIMDPYQIITWVPPEGGGGPNYEGM